MLIVVKKSPATFFLIESSQEPLKIKGSINGLLAQTLQTRKIKTHVTSENPHNSINVTKPTNSQISTDNNFLQTLHLYLIKNCFSFLTVKIFDINSTFYINIIVVFI